MRGRFKAEFLQRRRFFDLIDSFNAGARVYGYMHVALDLFQEQMWMWMWMWILIVLYVGYFWGFGSRLGYLTLPCFTLPCFSYFT